MSSNQYSENDLSEAKQLSMFAAIASLGYIFWLVGGMEIVERIAYYGVKASAGLYAKDPVSKGGLGISISDYGVIMFIWALSQTIVPIVTGGLSDRIGYKETIFLSTIIKISGYLFMAFFPTFWGFTVGALLLAFGTGVFKPGIQGTMVKATNRNNSTMAWGIFYQTVNIGGFIGPLLAAHFRQLEWQYVFFVCAAIISLNFLFLLMYKEPGKDERLAEKEKIKSGEIKQEALWKDSLKELSKPVVFWYMIVFSGFWFLFNALFDVLPIHIDDWVNTSTIVTDIFGDGGTRAEFWINFMGMNKAGTMIMPEAMISINFGLIMTTCFLVAAMSANYRIVYSMFAGAILSCVAIYMVGFTPAAWAIVVAVVIFSIGEMLISPKKGELMGNIAPKNKKAMYLGFVMLPQSIGWTLEGLLAPMLYEKYSSKEIFSLELLAERGMPQDQIAAIPQNEAFSTLVEFTGETAESLTTLLYNTHNIGISWYIITAIGSISAVGIFLYGKWLYKLQKQQLALSES